MRPCLTSYWTDRSSIGPQPGEHSLGNVTLCTETDKWDGVTLVVRDASDKTFVTWDTASRLTPIADGKLRNIVRESKAYGHQMLDDARFAVIHENGTSAPKAAYSSLRARFGPIARCEHRGRLDSHGVGDIWQHEERHRWRSTGRPPSPRRRR